MMMMMMMMMRVSTVLYEILRNAKKDICLCFRAGPARKRKAA